MTQKGIFILKNVFRTVELQGVVLLWHFSSTFPLPDGGEGQGEGEVIFSRKNVLANL